MTLMQLKTGPHVFYRWWTPLGDEGLFSEQQENIRFLNVFLWSDSQVCFGPHTSTAFPVLHSGF